MSSGITVIIPVFNGVAHIGECLASIYAQTLAPERIIVIDDGSDDGSAELVRGKDIQLVRKDHGGTSSARNWGLLRVQTEFVALADCDDLWLPQKLELQNRAMESQTSSAMIFGQVQQFLSPELTGEEASQLRITDHVTPGWMASNLFMRRADIERVGPFDETIQIGEFIEWFGRAKDAGVVPVMLPELTCRRRIHKNNTGRRDRDRRHEYLHALKKTLDRRRRQP